jgi:6-phosphogluconolactonase/glucosamine-6-phosphate isomerase/deaminase
VDRVTLTFPILNAGRKVIFQAVGREKKKIIDEFLLQKQAKLPAGRINPRQGELIWMLDRDAGESVKLE